MDQDTSTRPVSDRRERTVEERLTAVEQELVELQALTQQLCDRVGIDG